jgi:RNA-splicing ligase RtcB
VKKYSLETVRNRKDILVRLLLRGIVNDAVTKLKEIKKKQRKKERKEKKRLEKKQGKKDDEKNKIEEEEEEEEDDYEGDYFEGPHFLDCVELDKANNPNVLNELSALVENEV